MNQDDRIKIWLTGNPTDGFSSTEPAGPATSRGSFLGEDISDQAALGEDIFTEVNNLPLAIATVLNHAQEKADFHPVTQSSDTLSAGLQRYIYEIDQIPFYAKAPIHDKVSKSYNSGDYNRLIDAVVALYDGFPDSYRNDIKVAIRDMGRSVFGSGSGEGWLNLFAALTISMTDSSDPKILIYSTRLHMKHGKKKKDEVSRQEFEVSRNICYVSHQRMKENARSLAELVKTSVDDWTRGVTSPEKKGMELCFPFEPYQPEYA